MKNINDEFYPTPESLLEKIATDFVDAWEVLPSCVSILEPSAGKGDIADWLKKRITSDFWQLHNRLFKFNTIDIDCIETEQDLRSILKGKKLTIVHDNFLTFQTAKRYDLIFMNPPFSNGDKHLLKAINLQEMYGGTVVCILNAETILNPYSNLRKVLINRLEKYGAIIKYYDDAFLAFDAERRTDAKIAVIVVQIPVPDELNRSFIFERLDKAKQEKKCFFNESEENKEIVPEGLDYLDSYIKQFDEEVQAGIGFLKEYSAYKTIKQLRYSNINSKLEKEILTLKVNNQEFAENSINEFVETVRLRYWKALFDNPKFVGKLTSKMRNKLMSSVQEMKHYDFTIHNILELMTQIRDNTLKGIEDSLLDLFDTFSSKYSYWDETSKNIHYYNGWKTNKSYKVNKKVIIPLRAWSFMGRLSEYEVVDKLTDMAKALDYIAEPTYRNIDSHDDIYNQIKINFEKNITRNIETKYFILSFYLKGTCHLVFKDLELLEKFNLYVGKQRNWLPPEYGRKSYKKMNKEERAVADSFSGGEEGYNKIYENQTKYLVDSSQFPLLSETTSV